MTVTEQVRFLFTTLHSGRVNLILHLVSLPVIAVGLARHRGSLIALGGLLELIGHVYDYKRRFDQEKRRLARRVIPLQLLATGVVLVLLLKLFAWF